MICKAKYVIMVEPIYVVEFWYAEPIQCLIFGMLYWFVMCD
jgi:hypothetical protein